MIGVYIEISGYYAYNTRMTQADKQLFWRFFIPSCALALMVYFTDRFIFLLPATLVLLTVKTAADVLFFPKNQPR